MNNENINNYVSDLVATELSANGIDIPWKNDKE